MEPYAAHGYLLQQFYSALTQ
ncbi:hypothetical protein [Flavobacterium sp. J372]